MILHVSNLTFLGSRREDKDGKEQSSKTLPNYREFIV